MQTLGYLLLLIGGLVVLGAGGEFLIRGATRLARSLGISALVVGLTVVAYGTSAPELAVSVQAVLHDQAAIAVGNVVGSNIANVLLILGMAAAMRSFKVSLNLLKTDGPIMVAVAAVFMLLAVEPSGDGRIEPWEGRLLVVGLLVYTVFTYAMARRESQVVEDEYQAALGQTGSRAFNLLLIVSWYCRAGNRRPTDRGWGHRFGQDARYRRNLRRINHCRDRHKPAGTGHLDHRRPAQTGRHRSRQHRRQQYL